MLLLLLLAVVVVYVVVVVVVVAVVVVGLLPLVAEFVMGGSAVVAIAPVAAVGCRCCCDLLL